MWICFDCERSFDEPVVTVHHENLDGENGWWTYKEIFCPYCGSEYIEEDEMTLYDIDNRLRNFEPQVDEETGELLNAAELDELNMERDAKIEGVALWVKELDAEAAAIKAERDALTERQRAKERKRDSLKRYLDYALQGHKFETPKCKVSFRKTTSVAIGDLFYPWAEANAPELLRITQKVEPDKAAIKEALKNGMEMVDAELTEGVSLSVK